MLIIAVDDDAIARASLASILAEVAPEAAVRVFSDAASALEFAAAHVVDVAFLEVRLREADGLELARKLQALNPRVNIIFATGYQEYLADAFELRASGYCMKPVTAERVKAELANLRHEIAAARRVVIRTFGDFEVFIDGEPLKFAYSKTREMLAYLVDRNGSMCTNQEISAVVFDGKPDKNSYFKRLRADLLSTFEEAGCDDVVIRQHGKMGIAVGKVSCDYFDYRRNPEAREQLQDEYLAQYAWAKLFFGVLDQQP